MGQTMLNGRYIIEVLTPAQDDPGFESGLTTFAERYRTVLDHGWIVSIPDNPLGRLRFTATEVIEELGLEVDPARFLMHINTFHRREDLDSTLSAAVQRGVRFLLVVSGDGGPRLPRIEPREIGATSRSATSVELLAYIQSRYPGIFTCGVAFNHYEPLEHELEKLDRKLAAGARFVVTQPVIGVDSRLVSAMGRGVPVFVEAWMSRRIEVVYQCVGVSPPAAEPGAPPYSPEDNLRLLRSAYPTAGVYVSGVRWKKDWAAGLDGIEAARALSTARP